MFLDFLFYLFSAILLLSASAALFVTNPVINVLSLILAMFYSAGIFLLLKAEYLAFTLIIIYVGAVAILFLFVVMMLDVKKTSFKNSIGQFKTPLVFFGILLIVEMVLLLLKAKYVIHHDELSPLAFESFGNMTNAHAIGQVLYTQYFLGFQLVGLILFVAIIGAIVLVYEKRVKIHKQNIKAQLARTKKNSLQIIKFPPIVKKEEFDQ
ncbi:MAG TPA: NADH-quinone oxidoreductase subunit J [Holosporales bacterium]|nr:NADH-quinone oxidoreductase subunit J [Holosporales bacterium]